MLAFVSLRLGALGNWEGVYLMFMVSSVLGLWVWLWLWLLLLLLKRREGESAFGGLVIVGILGWWFSEQGLVRSRLSR